MATSTSHPAGDGAWRIEVEADRQAAGGYMRLAMDVDPRERVVRLGLRPAHGGTLDVQSGAVARSFFEASEADWHAASEWLASAEATALLETVAAGYTCDKLWTGDFVARWSDEAWEAGHTLWQRVAQTIG